MAKPKRNFVLPEDDPAAPTIVPVGEGEWQEFSEEPSEPPPDPDKSYAYIGGEWVLLASDSADGVPEKLDFPEPESDSTKAFDPHELRDEHGRWADSGLGSGVMDASGNTRSRPGRTYGPARTYRMQSTKTGKVYEVRKMRTEHSLDRPLYHYRQEGDTEEDWRPLKTPGGMDTLEGARKELGAEKMERIPVIPSIGRGGPYDRSKPPAPWPGTSGRPRR